MVPKPVKPKPKKKVKAKPKPKPKPKPKQKQKQKQSQNVRQVVNIYKPTRKRSYVKKSPYPPIQMAPSTDVMGLATLMGFLNQQPPNFNDPSTLEAALKQKAAQSAQPQPQTQPHATCDSACCRIRTGEACDSTSAWSYVWTSTSARSYVWT